MPLSSLWRNMHKSLWRNMPIRLVENLIKLSFSFFLLILSINNLAYGVFNPILNHALLSLSFFPSISLFLFLLSVFQHEFVKSLSPSPIPSRRTYTTFLYFKGIEASWSLGWCWYSCWDKKDRASMARSSYLLPDKLKLSSFPFYKDAYLRPSLRIKPPLWLSLIERRFKV